MKRIASLLFCLIFLLSLSGCADSTAGETEITLTTVSIIDEQGFLTDKPSESAFPPGTVVIVHSGVICDADLGMFVNGELFCKQTAVDLEGRTLWEYTYEVTNEDAVIAFAIIGGKPW